MKKQVVHIFGASGSGTSTLGREICRKLGFRFLDTDDFYWMPTDPKFTQKRPPEQRVELMREEILKPGSAVVSGSLVDWGDPLIPLFTLAVRLQADTQLRIQRLKQRERQEFGSRIDPGGDMYQDHLAFLEYAQGYDAGGMDMRSKAKHDAWQQLLLCPLLVLDGGGDLEENFAAVKTALDRLEH
ncbi:shikimate kinase [Clostridium sp. CAG:1013]|nr:shikimate kinase [Clostridium sp. CAG:1013]